MEIGVYTLARVTPDPVTGRVQSMGAHVRDLIEEIELADQVGLDVYGVGENHRPDFSVAAPAVVLAAAASRTKRIRLTSSVSVLGSADPVRLFQDFATVDLISDGRAEIMVGRGASTESFPLFGCDVDDYDDLFAEKLELLLRLRDQEVVTWAGRHRAPLVGQGVYPRPVQASLPVWVGVFANPNSAERAGRLGVPMALAFLAGTYERSLSVVNAYREAGTLAGHDPATLAVSLSNHGYVSETSQAVASEFFPYYASAMDALAIERGFPRVDRKRFRAMRELEGPVIAGSPDEVIEKILFQHEIFGNQRFTMLISVGGMPHRSVLRSIELFGTEVAPVVRAELASRTSDVSRPFAMDAAADLV
ncbi:MAG: hypothetical protein QOK43_882 [Acidimicrobiaceae bacterium]|nr:hypothetical protein [Acidimicrobiaceae bacterium]